MDTRVCFSCFLALLLFLACFNAADAAPRSISLEPRRLEEGAARELHGMKVLSCFGPTSCVVRSAVQGKTGEGRPAEENRKMVVESDDYPSSGANNRHDPTDP